MDAPEIVLLCFGGFALFFGILGCLALLTRHGNKKRAEKPKVTRLPPPDDVSMRIEDYGTANRPKNTVSPSFAEGSIPRDPSPVFLQSSEDSISRDYAIPRSQMASVTPSEPEPRYMSSYREAIVHESPTYHPEPDPEPQFSRSHRKSHRYQSFLNPGQQVSQATMVQPRATVTRDLVAEENELMERRNELYRRENDVLRKSILKKEEVSNVRRPMKLPAPREDREAMNVNAVRSEHSFQHLESDLQRVGKAKMVLFADEFEVLNQLEARRNRSTEIGRQNRELNRYADIIPYDDNLVGNKYINASHIESNGRLGRYIATQGPLDSTESDYQTVDDFWNMVWDNEVNCIIMLTAFQEDFMQKCGRYFPEQVGDVQHMDKLTLRLCSTTDDPYFVHREFDLSNGRRTRMVTHYEFKDWADGEVPRDKTQFLDFVQMIQTKGHKTPIVVHCSAGVGRTGVYIAIANNLDRAAQEGIVDVFTEVNRLRQQRPKMVTNQDQYQSIYEVLLVAAKRSKLANRVV